VSRPVCHRESLVRRALEADEGWSLAQTGDLLGAIYPEGGNQHQPGTFRAESTPTLPVARGRYLPKLAKTRQALRPPGCRVLGSRGVRQCCERHHSAFSLSPYSALKRSTASARSACGSSISLILPGFSEPLDVISLREVVSGAEKLDVLGGEGRVPRSGSESTDLSAAVLQTGLLIETLRSARPARAWTMKRVPRAWLQDPGEVMICGTACWPDAPHEVSRAGLGRVLVVVDAYGGASDNGAMTLHAWRPLSLDPLIGEAKRRARQRRVRGALVVLLTAGLATGLTLALRSPGGRPSGGLATARYPQDSLSFRYPNGLIRANWSPCSFGNGLGGVVGPIAVLTTHQAAESCPSTSPIPPMWPPGGSLGTNGVRILLTRVELWPRAYQPHWHGRLSTWRSVYLDYSAAAVGCPLGVQHETRSVAIRRSDSPEIVGSKPIRPEVISVDALICGPDFATGKAAFRQIVASTRFTR
jgi:hypothetical protein